MQGLPHPPVPHIAGPWSCRAAALPRGRAPGANGVGFGA